MIPATSFLLDGDVVLVVVSESEARDARGPHHANRPCDTCGGDGELEDNHPAYGAVMGADCPGCDGTGRHTFDIEVACPYPQHPKGCSKEWRVHVIDVLPIHDWCPDEKPADHICHAWKVGQQSEQWWHHRSFDHDDWTEREITLPPDAAPGKWLVRLAAHQ